jgi:hypothetical protein
MVTWQSAKRLEANADADDDRLHLESTERRGIDGDVNCISELQPIATSTPVAPVYRPLDAIVASPLQSASSGHYTNT